MVSRREIDSAQIEFRFECYCREVADDLRKAFESSLPEGLLLEDYQSVEKIDESAKGLELYSQAHEFTFSGSGRYMQTECSLIRVLLYCSIIRYARSLHLTQTDHLHN